MPSGGSTATQQATKSTVTLKGSAQIVSEFFNFGVNSILYQRGVYPSESFAHRQEYGLTLLMSTDEKVNNFLKEVIGKTQVWLEQRKVKKLVVVLSSVDTKEVLERWEFNVDYETEDGVDDANVPRKFRNEADKDVEKIKREIRDVIRQITASVTFLPLLDCLCSFDILIYTHKDLAVPMDWGESDPCFIQNPEEVKLKSFSTSIHKVETAVSYKSSST